MFSHAFSKSAMLSSSSLRATTAAMLYARLLPVLSSHAADGHPGVDVLPLAHAYAMDSFTAFQFGLRRGSNFLLDKGEREWYMESMYLFKKLGFWVTEMPVAVAWLRRVGVHVIPPCVGEQMAGLEAWNMAKFEGAERAVRVVASHGKEEDKQIGEEEEERIEEEKPENNPTIFAAQFAAFKKAFGDDFAADEKKHAASDPRRRRRRRRRLELASDQMDFNAAALETSGLTLTWLLYELSQRPALQRRLRDEALTLDPPLVFPPPSSSSLPPAHPPSSPTDDYCSLPDPKRLEQLPLLDAVLHETLRRWPAIAGRQPRVTPSVVTLAGHAGIPAGVTVQAYAYSLHRNGEVFAEPEEWRPERWMVGEDDDDGSLAEMRRWFWAFGSGGRVCVGRHFAVNAIKHAVAAIYTNFSTELVDADGIEQADGFIPSPMGEKLVLRFRRV